MFLQVKKKCDHSNPLPTKLDIGVIIHCSSLSIIFIIGNAIGYSLFPFDLQESAVSQWTKVWILDFCLLWTLFVCFLRSFWKHLKCVHRRISTWRSWSHSQEIKRKVNNIKECHKKQNGCWRNTWSSNPGDSRLCLSLNGSAKSCT